MTFQYHYTIRFQDTDAAGVVYFAQLLSICHSAYEASLQESGVDLKLFFSRGPVAVPITYTAAEFRRSLHCGDAIAIALRPEQTAADGFEIEYKVLQATGKTAAIATTHHVCIDPATHERRSLTPELTAWLARWTAVPQSPTGVALSD